MPAPQTWKQKHATSFNTKSAPLLRGFGGCWTDAERRIQLTFPHFRRHLQPSQKRLLTSFADIRGRRMTGPIHRREMPPWRPEKDSASRKTAKNRWKTKRTETGLDPSPSTGVADNGDGVFVHHHAREFHDAVPARLQQGLGSVRTLESFRTQHLGDMHVLWERLPGCFCPLSRTAWRRRVLQHTPFLHP